MRNFLSAKLDELVAIFSERMFLWAHFSERMILVRFFSKAQLFWAHFLVGATFKLVQLSIKRNFFVGAYFTLNLSRLQ